MIDWGALLPTATLPKLTLAGLIVSCGCAAVPDPVKGIVSGEPGAVLLIEILPVAVPAADGENFAVNVVVFPAASVAGTDRPVKLYPVPEALPCEMVMLAVPEFVRMTFTDALAPTSKLPKLTLEGFAARLPWTPVPVSGIVTVGSLAVLVMVIAPDAIPAVVGANCAVNVVL